MEHPQPSLNPPRPKEEKKIGAAWTRSVSSADRLPDPPRPLIESRDLPTVVTPFEARSGRGVHESLVRTLLTIAVEQTGAERGLLTLPPGDGPRKEAEAITGPHTVEVRLRLGVTAPARLPESVLNHVLQTRESVLLDDAAAPHRFSADAYIRATRARSIVCLPVVKQATLLGVLYLENSRTPSVFTPAQVALLTRLATRAAIALADVQPDTDVRADRPAGTYFYIAEQGARRTPHANDHDQGRHADLLQGLGHRASPWSSATAGRSPRTRGNRRCIFLASHGYRCIAHDRRGHGRSSQPWNGNEMDTYADDLAELFEALDLNDAVMIGHSTGGGEVARFIGRHGTKRVAKAVLMGAVPPLMLKTAANPGGLPKEVFDGFRVAYLADRSQFFLDVASGPFFGFNRPGAKVSQGLIQSWWMQGMMSGHKNAYDCIKAFSETDFTEDLKKFDVPTLIIHGDDDQIVPIGASAMLSSKLVKHARLKIYPGGTAQPGRHEQGPAQRGPAGVLQGVTG